MAPWTTLLLSLPCVTLFLLCCGCAKKPKAFCQRKGCFQGLFMPKQEWSMMAKSDGTVMFEKLFELKQYDVMTNHSENCGDYVSHKEGVTILNCSSSESTGSQTTPVTGPVASDSQTTSVVKRSASSSFVCEACCTTEMSFAVPETVVNVLTKEEYTVKHFTSTYQIISVGHCNSEGRACGSGGTCMQAFRVQWVLVINSTDPGQDTFVPASIPSHCTCIYT